MRVHELGHIVLYVRDIDRSAAFYTEVLGFRPVVDRPDGRPGVMYRTSSDRTHHELLLLEASPGAKQAATGERLGLFHFGVKIGDSEAEFRDAVAALRSSNVPITSAADHGATHSLYIEDPDGNEIELYVDVPDVDWRANPRVLLDHFKPIDI